MVDETTDVSNEEQAAICIRFEEDLDCVEEFIGIHVIPNTSAATLFKVVTDVLLRLNLNLDDCRGQCYDGASAMSGKRSGLKTLIQNKNSKALYVHCYAHTLSLAMNDTFKLVPKLSSMLDLCFEICKLIKKSPKREALMRKIKEESLDTSNGLRVLCPTRWTVRAASIESILNNYSYLQDVWVKTLDTKVDSEMRARVMGIQHQMKNFDMYFAMHLGLLILQQTYNLSCALQAISLSAGNVSTMAKAVLDYLQSKRTDTEFEKFYGDVMRAKDKEDVDDPTLPRPRKTPARFEEGSHSTYNFPEDAKVGFRRLYFSAIDNTIGCIESRFSQDLEHYTTLCQVLLYAAKGEELEPALKDVEVSGLYNDDFNFGQLKAQLSLIQSLCSTQCITNLDEFAVWFHSCGDTRNLLPSVESLLRLILTLPATCCE